MISVGGIQGQLDLKASDWHRSVRDSVSGLKDLQRQSESTAGGVGKLSPPIQNATVDLERLTKTAKDVAVGFVAGATGFSLIAAGGLAAGRAIEQGFEAVGHAAIGMNANLETATLQFKVLMGDADQARDHVKGLFEFAKATPFETGPLIEASRIMQVMGGAALNTSANLRMIGDAAAGASAPINEVAGWVSRAYSAIQAGRPFGEAGEQLMRLGLLSGDARAQMEKLAAGGASAAQIWAVLTGELGRFSGSMNELQGTWTGLTSTATDSINLLMSGALKPLFELAKEGLGEFNRLLDSKAVEDWGKQVAATLRDVKTELDKANQARVDVQRQASVPMAAAAAVLGTGTADDVSRAAGGRQMSQFQRQQLDELADMGLSPDEWRARYEKTLAAIDAENQKLAAALTLKALAPGIEKDIDALGAKIMARYQNVAEEAAAAGPTNADRWLEALGLAETNRLIGGEGTKLVEAVTGFITDGSTKNRAAAAQWATAIMDAWKEKLDPAVAAARIAELQAAVDAAMSGQYPDAGSIAGLLAGTGAEDQKRAADERARRDDEAAQRKREQDQRTREAAQRKAESEAKAAAAEAERQSRTASRGFSEAFASAQSLQDFVGQSGDLGGKSAQAFAEAFAAKAPEAMSKGEAAMRTVTALGDRMKELGIPEWRTLMNLLASTMATAFEEHTEEAKAAALGMLDQVVATIRSAEAFTPARLFAGLTDANAKSQMGSVAVGLFSGLEQGLKDGAQNIGGIQSAMIGALDSLKGLSAEQGTAFGQTLMEAVAEAVADGSPEAMAGLRAFLVDWNGEILQARAQLKLDESLKKANDQANQALETLNANRLISEDVARRREGMTTRQRSELDALQATAKQEEEAARERRRKFDEEEKARKATQGPLIALAEYQAMTPAQRAAYDRTQANAAAVAAVTQNVQDAAAKRREAFDLEEKARRERNELALGKLREQHAREAAQLGVDLEEEGARRRIGEIEAARLVQTEAAHTAFADMLTSYRSIFLDPAIQETTERLMALFAMPAGGSAAGGTAVASAAGAGAGAASGTLVVPGVPGLTQDIDINIENAIGDYRQMAGLIGEEAAKAANEFQRTRGRV